MRSTAMKRLLWSWKFHVPYEKTSLYSQDQIHTQGLSVEMAKVIIVAAKSLSMP